MKNARTAWFQGGLTRASAVALTSWLLCSSGCAASEGDEPVAEDRAKAWQATLDETGASSGFFASTLGVWSSKLNMDSPWVGVTGVRDTTSKSPMDPGDTLRIGSVTKTFVATVTLQLVQEGKLDLEAPLSRWGGFGISKDEEITVSQLLEQTSGIVDYLVNPDAQMHLAEPQTAQQLVDYVAGQELKFEPGTSWHYSNTNYVLLGMIIEQVTGESWAEQVHQRIIEPLGLRHTFIAGYDAEPGSLIPGYMAMDGDMVDVAGIIDSSWAGAAGAIISNAEDLVLFGKALFHGELVDRPLLDQMTSPLSAAPASDGFDLHYGMGLMVIESDDWTMIGHGGTYPGYESWFSYIPSADLVIASIHNSAMGPDGKTPQNRDETMAFLKAHLGEIQQQH